MRLQDLVGARAQDWFERLGEAINLPDSRYEDAERSYKSVCKWLEREESEFIGVDVSVYTQGSFRLGTAIKPYDREDEYDLDIVCEFELEKLDQTQQELHARLGRELSAYASRYGMDSPDGWDRCWTLSYADSARFHMDVLPCVPDASRQRMLRESASLSQSYVEDSVAITDRTHCKFRIKSDLWPASNPNGFAKWFYDRMRPAFDSRREALRLVEAKADVAEIPEFRVKTPLQLAVQILKRHRDVYFSSRDSNRKPSSIVITTLAAHAYGQQSTVLDALLAITREMGRHVHIDGGRYFIPNPSNPRENFADSWDEAKAQAFFEWAEVASGDFDKAQSGADVESFVNSLAPNLGRSLVEAAVRKTVATAGGSDWKIRRIENAKHRKVPGWPVSNVGRVQLTATQRRNGFRTQPLESDAPSLPIGCSLTFTAQTNVPSPYEIYWQIVNTGVAATDANGLRGGFESPRVKDGHLVRSENTEYPGSHSIECFVVKNGFVAARSGLFLVNVGNSRF